MNFKKIKWLIPVLAILVIFESILIVQRLSRKASDQLPGESGLPSLPEKEMVVIAFGGLNEAVVGQESEVAVAMVPLKSVALDGIDVLIEYDPEYLEIVGTDPSERFSYLARNWIEPDKKRILVSMVETDLPAGVNFEPGEEVNLVVIRYLPFQKGKTGFRIIGSETEAGTVLAENGTAAKIPFSSEDFGLTISE